MTVVILVVRWLLLAAAVALAVWTVPGVSLDGGLAATLWVSLLIALGGALLQLVLPEAAGVRSLLLLALVTLVANGLLVWLVAALSDALTVDGFLPAVSTAIMISVFSVALHVLLARFVPEPDAVSPGAAPGSTGGR